MSATRRLPVESSARPCGPFRRVAKPAIVASGATSPLGAAGYSVRLLADRLATHRFPWPSMVTADGLQPGVRAAQRGDRPRVAARSGRVDRDAVRRRVGDVEPALAVEHQRLRGRQPGVGPPSTVAGVALPVAPYANSRIDESFALATYTRPSGAIVTALVPLRPVAAPASAVSGDTFPDAPSA